jgi:predicted nucleic acid-binding protein
MLLDTSGLLCVHHEAEQRHENAVTFFHAASTRFTHSYVLAEFVPLCQVRGLPRSAALSFVVELIDNPLVEVIWVDSLLHRVALAFLQTRLDKTYSLCDAVSFLLMQQRSITEALTTDHHFEQEGFRRLL